MYPKCWKVLPKCIKVLKHFKLKNRPFIKAKRLSTIAGSLLLEKIESIILKVKSERSTLKIHNCLFHNQLFRFRLSAERYFHKIVSGRKMRKIQILLIKSCLVG